MLIRNLNVLWLGNLSTRSCPWWCQGPAQSWSWQSPAEGSDLQGPAEHFGCSNIFFPTLFHFVTSSFRTSSSKASLEGLALHPFHLCLLSWSWLKQSQQWWWKALVTLPSPRVWCDAPAAVRAGALHKTLQQSSLKAPPNPSQADRHLSEVLCFLPLLQGFSLWSCSVRILFTVMRMGSRRKGMFLFLSDL